MKPFGQAVAHLRSPCEGCTKRKPDYDCAPDCEKRRAFLQNQQRDTRFDTDMKLAGEATSEKDLGKLATLAAAGEKRQAILHALGRVIKRWQNPHVTRKALAEELGTTSGALAYHLKAMETEGYVVIIPGDGGPTAPVLVGFPEPKNNGPVTVLVEETLEPQIAEIPEVAAPKEYIQPGPRPCKDCGQEPEKIDSLGRPMGFCSKCLSRRGKKNLELGSKHGWQPFNIPLNDPKYAEIKKWVEDTAEEFEQDLPRAVMFRLKLACQQAKSV
jgi:hypothetical protein